MVSKIFGRGLSGSLSQLVATLCFLLPQAALALPTVTLTAPTAGTYVSAAPITLRATANPSAGLTITKVEFIRSTSTIIGTVNGATTPHVFNWTNPPTGAHVLKAKAYDSSGNTTSATVNITVVANAAPVVTITVPANNSYAGAPANIVLTATATDSTGTVSKVEFFNGTTLVDTKTAPPYTTTFTNLPKATYTLKAKATDSFNATAEKTVTVTVRNPPTATLTAPPAASTTVAFGASVTLTATTTVDTAGSSTLTNVTFKRDNGSGPVQIGSPDASSPYSLTWTANVAGTHQMTATALDSRGLTGVSPAKTVIVNPPIPPTVTLAALNPTYTPGSNITLTATASAGSGSLTNVTFKYNSGSGPVQIGSPDINPPYSLVWSNVPAGVYDVTATALNSNNATTVSAPRHITVGTAPTVSITSPTAGTVLTAPATINITANASGGTIAKVEFYDGATKLGEVLAPPYNWSIPNSPMHSYQLKAIATNSIGLSGTSAVVPVIVDGPDTCEGAPPLAAKESSTMLASFPGPASYFEANLGQANEAVKFRRGGPGYQLFLTSTERVMALRGHGAEAAKPVALRMKFVGSNPNPEVSGAGEVEGRSNYLLGSDTSKWHRQVPNFASVRYRDLYPGIDEVYRAEGKSLEYDLHVAAGVDPLIVRFAIDGAERVEIAPEGDLMVRTARGTVIHKKPVAFQEVDGVRRNVDASYRRISEREFGFVVAQYDATRSLVIDPLLVYSTLVGGSDDTWATGIALSRCGEAYITGSTWATDYPTTAGAFDRSSTEDSFMGFVSKLNPSGTALIYSTYVSGNTINPNTGSIGQVTQPAAIALDATGHAYIAGSTEAIDFPVTPGSWQQTPDNDVAGFVTKLNSNGSDLIYSTYAPISRLTAIAVDSGNNALITGTGHVWKVNPAGSAYVYHTGITLGDNTSLGIAVDTAGSAYVVGNVDSEAFAATPGAFQTTKPSSTSFGSAWLVKLDAAGDTVFATYLGTNGSSNATAVAVDSAGSAYVTGYADGGSVTNFVGPSAFFALDSSHPSTLYAFVTKVAPNGSSLAFYTRYGGTFCSPTCFAATTRPRGIALDSTTGSIWIAGETDSNKLQFQRPLFTAQASGKNMFAAKVSSTGTTLQFSSLIGGVTSAGGTAEGAGIRVDSAGSAYVAGSNIQTDFPTTAGAFQTTTQVPTVRNAFVAKINENKDTTTTLAASPPVGAVGSPTTLTATLAANAPTGNVTFKDGGNTLGTGTVSGTTAQFTTSAFLAGSHTLTASYEGDAHNNPSVSDPITYSVADPNAPPTAFTITGITDGQILTANIGTQYVGGSISASATAAFGNTIANVIIFVDGQGYTWSPNSASWSSLLSLPSLGVGTHTIRGTATDSNGNARYAAPIRFVVNASGATPPSSVAITFPSNGATLAGPGTFTLQATAGATATIVNFYANSALVATIGGPPFAANWVNPAAGTYSLVAVASDATGAARVSAPITVTVTGPAKPTVTLTSPANNSEFWVNQPITIAATATAAGTATIDRVELYDNELLMTTRTALPYQTVVTPSNGTHVMFARAYDSLGQFAESKRAVVLAKSAAPPTVSLTAPTDGQTFTNPASITISATASAVGDATITKVDFYDGSTIVGTAIAPPYTIAWNQPPGGSHYIMAVVTDSRYQFAQTPQVSISIQVDQLSIMVDPGIDESTVNGESTLITGTVQAPPNSGVSINGAQATLAADGSFFLNDAPLTPGSNTVTLIVTNQDGATASQIITIHSTGNAPLAVEIQGIEGLPGLEVALRTSNPGGLPVATVEFDINGDGIADYVAPSLSAANVIFELPTPGSYPARITFKDANGLVLGVVSKRIYVFDPAQRYGLLRGVFLDFRSRLAGGSAATALNLVLPQTRTHYQEIFNQLGADLASFSNAIGSVERISGSTTEAEIVVSRVVAGTNEAFFIYLIRDGDGIWRIDSM